MALPTPFVVTGAGLPFLAPVGVFDDGAWCSSSEADSKSEPGSEAELEAESELKERVSDKARAGDREVDFCRGGGSDLEVERETVAGAGFLSFSTLMLRIVGSIGALGVFTIVVFSP